MQAAVIVTAAATATATATVAATATASSTAARRALRVAAGRYTVSFKSCGRCGTRTSTLDVDVVANKTVGADWNCERYAK